MAINSPAVGDPIPASQADAIAAILNASVVRFRGLLAASAVVAATTNIAYAATEDPSAGWNATTHLWTVPAGAAGLYHIEAQGRCSTSSVPVVQVVVNGTPYVIGSSIAAAGIANASTVGITKALAVGDTVAIQSVNAYTATSSGNDNFFALYRAGNT